MIMNINERPCHKDDRGEIRMILESCQIGSISRISSHTGSTRANHYHPNDYHFIEVLQGIVELYERPVGSKEKPILKMVHPGDIALTNPNIEHTMYFPYFTVFNCYSHLPRNKDNYEKETIRFDYSLRDIYNNWKD